MTGHRLPPLTSCPGPEGLVALCSGKALLRPHDSFTFQVLADGHVRLALVGVREADDAVIVATKQAATAPRLFRRYAPNVLLWTVPSDKA